MKRKKVPAKQKGLKRKPLSVNTWVAIFVGMLGIPVLAFLFVLMILFSLG